MPDLSLDPSEHLLDLGMELWRRLGGCWLLDRVGHFRSRPSGALTSPLCQVARLRRRSASLLRRPPPCPYGRRVNTDRGHRIDAWVAEGIISTEQAALIRDFEEAETVPVRRISLAAEAIIYLGAALAIGAGFALLAETYSDLSRASKVGVPLAAGLIFLGAGWPMRRSGEPAVQRLASVLWLLSAMAFAWVLNELIRPGDETGRWRFLLVGASAGAYAIALYSAFRRHATQLGAFAGSWAAIGGAAAAVVGTDEPFGNRLRGRRLPRLDRLVLGRSRRPGSLRRRSRWRSAPWARSSPLSGSPIVRGSCTRWRSPVAAGLVVASAGGADPRSAASLVVAGLGLFGYIFAAIMEISGGLRWSYLGAATRRRRSDRHSPHRDPPIRPIVTRTRAAIPCS